MMAQGLARPHRSITSSMAGRQGKAEMQRSRSAHLPALQWWKQLQLAVLRGHESFCLANRSGHCFHLLHRHLFRPDLV